MYPFCTALVYILNSAYIKWLCFTKLLYCTRKCAVKRGFDRENIDILVFMLITKPFPCIYYMQIKFIF